MAHNVLHVLGTAQPHGSSIARIVGQLASGLTCQRYRIHAWFISDDGPLTAELQKAGVNVQVIRWRGGRRDPIGAWRFWRALCDKEFKIIHQHYGGRSVRWLARRGTHARIIVHLHGREDESRGPCVVPVKIRLADSVIATSQSVGEVAVGWRPHVVYPGVDIPNRSGCGKGPDRFSAGTVIGTARRLIPIKGIIYLIRAFALLRRSVHDVRLEIAGSGPERPLLESEVRLLGLEDCITFLGWREDLDSVLKGWQVFVLPSLEEGFGVAALEAMAAGLPVIASAVGGVPELVEDGRTGLLVPPGNSAALAHCLRELLLNPEQRLAMGTAGRIRARECFSSERMVEQISKIYDDLLSLR